MKRKIYAFDLFRVIIVFFVLLFHSNIHLNCQYGLLTTFVSQSAIFMTAFFILSGFCIYYNYHDVDLSDFSKLKMFYVKRIIRIYPLYLLIYIIFIIFYNTLTLKQNILIAPIELLTLQSFFSSLFSVLHNGGTWFVSCIFFCYLLFPLFKVIISKAKYKKIMVFSLYLIAAISPFIARSFKTSDVYSNPFFRLLEFLIGAILADLVLQSKEKPFKGMAILLLVDVFGLLIGVTFLDKYFHNDYQAFNFITIPVFSIIVFVLPRIKNKILIMLSENIITQYLSKISFAFFMAQFFTFNITKIIVTLLGPGDHINIKTIIIAILVNTVLAVLMYTIVEKPCTIILTKHILANKKGSRSDHS